MDVEASDLRRVILEFVAAETLAESQRILEANTDLILSNQGIAMLEQLAEEQPQLREVLEDRRHLLIRCRDIGIEPAFNEHFSGGPADALSFLLRERCWAELEQLCAHLLSESSREAPPELWAYLQSLKGVARNERTDGDRAQNLEGAIAAYHLALEVYTREAFPVDWATTQANLGNTLKKRIEGDRAQNLEEAVSAYQAALQVYTREALPGQWAAAQASLGDALQHRILGVRSQNLEAAIAAWHLALQVYTREAFPVEWAAVQASIGSALQGQVEGDRAQNLEDSITAWRLALQVYKGDAFPGQRAAAQANLGDALLDRTKGDRARNIEEAIAAYQAVLQVYTREAFPADWATAQANLGYALSNRIRGNRTQNLEEAITACRLALAVYTWEASPVKWASAQTNLGYALLNRTKGDRAQNLEEAIAACRLALQVYTREAFPADWAGTQVNLGTALLGRIEGDPAQNFEETIAAYQAALQVRTREDFPADWAAIQAMLGTAMQSRSREDRAQNLEGAVAAYHLALQVYTREAFPVQWATTQFSLGTALHEWIRRNQAPNFEEVIAAYHLALQVYTREAFPVQWAMTQRNLGAVWQERISRDRAQDLEEAIAACRLALQVYTREAFPGDWGAAQSTLGLALSNRIRGDRAQNFEEAIAAYQAALQVYTREAFPEEWARTQNNLGIALLGRIEGDRAQNLEEAIAACRLALAVYTREAFLEEWAGTLDTLGSVLSSRIRGDHAHNLEEAIAAYRLALQVRTREAFPVDWARTQNNLGIALQQQIREDHAHNLEEAIAAYRQALQVRTREAFPADWAHTQRNLGTVLQQRMRGDQAHNFEEAIAAYRLALAVYTREAFPEEWARTQNNLGIALLGRIEGDRAQNLEEAIAAYRLALQVYTRGTFPIPWAATQINLGNALQQRISGDRAQNLEGAITAYRLALEVFAPATLPEEARLASSNLGRLLYKLGLYSEARDALKTAHDAIRQIRGETSWEATRERLSEENASLYCMLVDCCLRMEDEEGGFEFAAAAKGRAFIDLLRTGRVNPYQTPADYPELQDLLGHARGLQESIDSEFQRARYDALEGGTNARSRPERFNARRLDQLYKELETVWVQIRNRHPAFAATVDAPAISVREANQLAATLDASLVEYFEHAGGWVAFVFDGSAMHVVPLLDTSGSDPIAWLQWLDDLSVPEWRGFASLEELHDLHTKFVAPILTHIPENKKLIFAPFWWQHLVPIAAAREPATGRYLADRNPISFVPSLGALDAVVKERTGHRAKSRLESSLRPVVVCFPGDDPEAENYLRFALVESDQVARHLQNPVRLGPNEASVEHSLQAARASVIMHFGCHGQFSARTPRAGAGLRLKDGLLSIQRIVTELQIPRMALLTAGACYSAMQHPRPGDEPSGLVQSLMLAGAQTVVGALWAINDAATAIFFDRFYDLVVNDRLSPAQAVNLATQAVRAEDIFDHPYYWAAFQAIGLAHEPVPDVANMGRAADPSLTALTIDGVMEMADSRDNSPRQALPVSRSADYALRRIAAYPDRVSELLSRSQVRDLVEELDQIVNNAAKKDGDALGVEVLAAVEDFESLSQWLFAKSLSDADRVKPATVAEASRPRPLTAPEVLKSIHNTMEKFGSVHQRDENVQGDSEIDNERESENDD